MNISAEARKHGIAPLLAHQRIRRGWTVERATSEKPRAYFYEWRGLVWREDRPQARSEARYSAKSRENDTRTVGMTGTAKSKRLRGGD